MNRLDCGLVELKFAGAETMTFSGYGAVFKNVDAYGDVIEPGAMAKFLSDTENGEQPWPMMLAQHGGLQLTSQDMTPIGVWTELSEDGHGLKVSGQLADTDRGREMYTLMKMSPRPAIDGLSIGYIAKKSEPRSKPEDPRRRLTEIDLIEISVVSRPANRKARVNQVKSIASIRQFETFLRDVGGFSLAEAKAIASKGFGALSDLRDAGDDGSDLLQALMRRGKALT